jgi:hypothetical protein
MERERGEDHGIWCDWSVPPLPDVPIEIENISHFREMVNEACLGMCAQISQDGEIITKSMLGKEEEMSSESKSILSSIVDFFSIQLSIVLRHVKLPLHFISHIRQLKFGISFADKKKILKSSFVPHNSPFDLYIDRTEAMHTHTTPISNENDLTLSSSGTFLSQLFHALKISETSRPSQVIHFSPKVFQQLHSFRIQNDMESAVDLKGPYRNFLSDLCSEWWGDKKRCFPLFVQSDGFKSEDGEYDWCTWVPNLECTRSEHFSFYRLIGQVIGCILYGDVQVELMWSSVTWRFLIGKEVTVFDFGYFNLGMRRVVEHLISMDEEEWGRDIGGVRECMESLFLFLPRNDAKELIMRCQSLLEFSKVITSLSSPVITNEDGDYDFPYMAKEILIRQITLAFQNLCERQLNYIREGLYSSKFILCVILKKNLFFFILFYFLSNYEYSNSYAN